MSQSNKFYVFVSFDLNMNLNQLRTFFFAVKLGSFSAAAEALFITQPAVTKQIQQLQSAFEVKLLNRFGKKSSRTLCPSCLRHAESILIPNACKSGYGEIRITRIVYFHLHHV